MTEPPVPTRRSAAGATALGAAATIVSPLPAFLTGAMVVQITEDVAFGAAGLGLAIGLSRAGQAVSSFFLGPLADRLGASRSLRISMLIAAVASVGIATTVTNLVTLCAWLVVASLAHALGQPATNRLLIRQVQPGRLGTAFGLKQAASPGSSMLAGFAVPAIAVTLGWRWAFALVALLALGVIVAIGRRGPTAAQRAERKRDAAPKEALSDRRLVALLALAFGFALAANVIVPTFYVASAVEAGSSSEFAGTMLALGSGLAIATRLIAGVACDRIIRRPLLLCAGLLTIGGLGIGLLATLQPQLMTFGALLALTGAWGFNGVFWFAVVRAYANTPGRITGLLSPGGSLGATLGSILFGVVAQYLGYSVAWLLGAVIAVLAGVGLAICSRLVGEARTIDEGGT